MCLALLSSNLLSQVGKSLLAFVPAVLNDISACVRGEVAGPCDVGVAGVLARCYWVAANGRDDGGVREGRLGRDDAVGDVVVDGLRDMVSRGNCRMLRGTKAAKTYRMLFLLHIKDSLVGEGPSDDISLRRRVLDELASRKLAPEGREVLELDEVPDLSEGSFNDGGFRDEGGGGDVSRHCD